MGSHASCQGSEWEIGVWVCGCVGGDAVGARGYNSCVWKQERKLAIEF